MSTSPASASVLTSGSEPAFPVFRLLVLAGAIFVSVSSEFLPTALLPNIAADLGVSESKVGILVTVFAGTVALTSIPMTILTRRHSRKALLIITLSVFAISNVLSAIAPTYETLLATRVLGGLAHGLFWAVAGPYAALLVTPRQLARAIALTTGGGSLAFILGVPFAAALGFALGWRLAFVAMAVLVTAFLVLTIVALPSVDHRPRLTTGAIAVPLRQDRSLRAVLLVAVSVLLLATGHNAFYTYIAPWTIQIGGVSPDLVSVVLLAFGLAGLLGAVLAGVFGDRWPRLFVNVAGPAVAVMCVLLALFGHGFIAVVVLMMMWSTSFGGLPPMLHTRNLHGSSVPMRAISGSIITTAFNIAIGLGALVGGVVLDHLGLAWVPWVSAGIVIVGAAFTLATDRARIAAHPADAHRG
ncbi:MFS transporter [Naasia lichenicola]|uniref:MFS transporter n=1 Tax=Naasia lichenicola TaxID=2565933 RepID=UPI00130D9321|nr:MFS transporter [Naasia lichenicola]